MGSICMVLFAGCGDQSATGASQGSSRPSIGSGSISVQYTIEVDQADPLCRTASIGSKTPRYSCSADDWAAVALASETVGGRFLEMYILPLAAKNPRLEPSYPSRLLDNYLVLERSVEDSRAFLKYEIQGVTVECELNGPFSECKQITR